MSHLARSDRHFAWLQIGFLAAVALMPFSTSLLGEHIGLKTALISYWFNILLLGAALLASWLYAERAGLPRDNLPSAVGKAIRRRIILAQALYAFGAALCLFGTFWSIAFIVAVQLNYAFAPKWPWANADPAPL